MKKPSRRQVLWGVVALVVVVLLAWALRPRPAEADFATVGRGALEVTVDEEGETRVRERFVVSAPLAGKVLRIELEPGDAVAAGDAVATLAPAAPALQDARTRRELEALVDAARASLQRAEAELSGAEAERDFAAMELERTRRLADAEVVSQERLDAASTDARAAEEAVRAARAAVAAERQSLAAARARLVQASSARLGDDGEAEPEGGEPVVVRAPVDGVVLQRLRESETVVPAGDPLLELADPADLEIVSDLLSTDAVRVDPGDPVHIERWGGDVPLRGRVRRVEPYGFTKISALGVEEQRVNVVIDFVDPRAAWEELGDGYRVEIRVVVWSEEGVVKVPTSALFRRPSGMQGGDGADAGGTGGGRDVASDGSGGERSGPRGEPWAVFRVRDGVAELAPVVVGRKNGLEAQVLSGLEPGDTVIAHPSDSIEDGIEVKPRG